MHQNWTGRGGETQALYQMEEAQNDEGFTTRKVTERLTDPTDEELDRVYKNASHWITTPGMKEATKGAYNENTATLFKSTPINPLFAYKYRPDTRRGEIRLQEVENKFWKAIEGIPGKARHRNLHMALIARGPFEWTTLHLRAIKIVMASRIAPKVMKQLSRLPIPKPGKQGDSRPLSLIDDK